MTEKRMTGPSRPEVTGRERSGIAGNVIGLLAKQKADVASTLRPPVPDEPTVSASETVVESAPEATEQAASDAIDVAAVRAQINTIQSQNQKEAERVREAMRDSAPRPL